jgi:DUF4097 and DUF4098 domain-containing protein YvlB
MTYEFETPTPPQLAVHVPAGRVDLATAESPRTTVEVEARRGSEEDVLVEQHGDQIVVDARGRQGEYDVRIRAPHGVEAETDTASADLLVRGRLGALDAKAATGDVEVEQTDGDTRVRSASGDVSVGSVGGRADVNSASGDVTLGTVGGDLSVRTASGDVHVAEPGAGISIYTASGDQQVGAAVEGLVDLKSASGDIVVGIKRGSRVHVDARSMTGETTSELELGAIETSDEGPLVELRAVTMSGDIRIARA